MYIYFRKCVSEKGLEMKFIVHETLIIDPSPYFDFILRVVHAAEQSCGFGIESQDRQDFPIYFVSKDTMDSLIDREAFKNYVDDMEKDEGCGDEEKILDSENQFVEELRRGKLEDRCRRNFEMDRELKDRYTDSIDPWGYYLPQGVLNGSEKPEIWICFDKIYEFNPNMAGTLLASVVIHEFGHSIMDLSPSSGLSEYSSWVEEPLANMITLYYMKGAEKECPKGYDIVKDFALHNQPPRYTLGAFLYDIEQTPDGVGAFDWLRWGSCKGFMDSKRNELHNWRSYAAARFSNPDPQVLMQLFSNILN